MSRSFIFPGVLLLLIAAACSPTVRQSGMFSEIPRPAPGNTNVAWPGPRSDGSVLLPNQWSLRPAGQQIELADFPVNIAVHPSGRFAAVLHSGYSDHQIVIVDIPAAQVVSRVGIREAFYGLAFSENGKKLICSGAGEEIIHLFDFDKGKLLNHTKLKLRDPKKR